MTADRHSVNSYRLDNPKVRDCRVSEVKRCSREVTK
jgi:hypothetical protein